MSDPKHTPGPWVKVGNALYQGDRIDGRSTTGSEKVVSLEEVTEANARLLAAAPETAAERDQLREINRELLEALEWIADTSDAWREHELPGGETAYEWLYGNHFLDIARAAIAKAKGGER